MNTLLTKEQIESYETNGFLLVEDFLNEEELSLWREVVTESVKQRAGEKMPRSDIKTGDDDGINENSKYFGKVFDQMINLWQTNDKVKQMMLIELLVT